MSNRTRQRRRWSDWQIVAICLGTTVLVVVIGLAAWRASVLSGLQDEKECTECKVRLREIAKAVLTYRQHHGHFPQTPSGVRFLLAPIVSEKIAVPESDRAKLAATLLVCPADPAGDTNRAKISAQEGGFNGVTAGVLSFAGRNTIDYPINERALWDEIIACDAGGADGCGRHHGDIVNIVYADATVGQIDLKEYPSSVRDKFSIGPNSPIPELRCLNKRLE